MDELTEQPRRWDEAAYQRFAAAAGDEHDLVVRFENGDEVRLDVRRLADVGDEPPAWGDVTIEPFEIRLTIGDAALEVPWTDVRALSDDAFASYMAERAGNQAREVGHRLRLLRERRRLSGRELAERAGISPQSLSRIERGRHDIVFSMLQRLLAAMSFELADLAAAEDVEVAPARIRDALAATGLHRETVARVLYGAENSDAMLARVRRMFSWSATDVAGPGPPPLLGTPALAGRFKAQARGRLAAATYVMYAHTVALLVEQASVRPAYEAPPDDPAAIAAEVRARYGDLGFESLLRYCWGRGIVVLPLFDPGQFHGACWLVGERPVIVVKQRTAYRGRWAFDLGHELAHVIRHLRPETPSIVELDEIGWGGAPDEVSESEEVEASDFSGELLLGEPDDVAQRVVAAANGRVQRLPQAVPTIASREGVDVGVLANYVAHRLSTENGLGGVWGIAANLQKGTDDAPQIARRLLEDHLNWNRLTPDDVQVLRGALKEGEE